ncbi:hypothetical protein POJ06DRAFT_54260 [Lipomyces tetrasporus]|uniref:Uncharacterized protein n=1 Tax=Lipomyces tetrasporus TaxID=54092 RepID=A0AAD7VU37_9ASCO|nr:uncharacterized protein POJ06DRAFT_54260 [Lipomyces tetrasporus]KAJ8102712.1 hypothetical protein POJ06DRAFT_54260 [Lipomyces tetrasporus]
MEQSVLMNVVRRPLSPDAKIEVPATWAEYEYAQEHLDTEGNKFPRLWYDSANKLATVVAAPTPLHSDMVGELIGHLSDACNDVMRRGGISETIREGVTRSADTTNRTDTRDGLTIREWDAAISYVFNDERTLMVAFEVGVSQTYRSLRAAISWCVCDLHCRLGIAMNIIEKDRGERPSVRSYACEQERNATIRQARDELRLQLRQHPFGPLEWNNITWFGKLRRVVIETFRNEDPNCPPGTLLEPTQSFVIVRDGRFSGEDVPPNLKEIVLGDCVPSHILSGNEIVCTPLDFFRRSWFEAKTRSSILDTAVQRVEEKHRMVRAH